MMKSIFKQALLVATFGLVIFTIACNDDEELPQVEAGFTSSINQETGVVTFTNTSVNATDYSWDFGDGTSSTQENPTKTYTEDGDYDVVLTASNGSVADTFEETITIALVVVDETAPVITLEGAATVEIEIGEDYTDAGATATDDVDGNVTENIIVGGDQVNTFQPGTYTITYNVTDNAGNAATQVTRTVTVTWEGSGLLTNGDFEDGNTGWTGNGLDVRTEGGNSYTFANVTTAGASFDVNVSQILELTAGSTYMLSFNASSDMERTLIAGIGLNSGNFASSTETVNLNTATQRFSLVLRATFGDMNSRVLFDMGAAVGVVVIDNVSLMEIDDPAPAPIDAPETPMLAEGDVKSLFSDAYTDVPVDTWSAEWDDAYQEDVMIAGNTVKKVYFGRSQGGFLGVDFSSNSFDASVYTHFHMDYWIADDFTPGQILNPKWSNHAPTGGEINAFEYTNAIGDGQSGTWRSIDVPISSFAAGSTIRDNLAQLIIATGQTLEVVYLDNIYLYTAEITAGPELYLDGLNNASDVNSWTKIADATGNANVTIAHSADGGVDGTGAIELAINVDAGGAYILRYQKTVDYAGNAGVRVSYDAKVTSAISGSALHFQSQVPQDGGGIITTNTFDTQNQINDTGFITISQDITGVGTGTDFIIDLNFATGGAAQGSVLIDNIKIEAIE